MDYTDRKYTSMFVILATLISLSASAEDCSLRNSSGNYLVAIANAAKTWGEDVFYECTGTIIDDRFIVTAASCVINYGQTTFQGLRVDDGLEVVYNRVCNDPSQTKIGVEKIYVPKDYDHNSLYDNNIAVLKLKESLNLENNTHLRKLRLPQSSDSDYVNHDLRIAGFGLHTLFQSFNFNNEDVHANGSVFYNHVKVASSSSACSYGGSSQSSGKICIEKTPEKDEICFSDKGGPLVDESNVLVGIQVGPAPLSCDDLHDTIWNFVYTKVSSHIDFIEKAKNDSL